VKPHPKISFLFEIAKACPHPPAISIILEFKFIFKIDKFFVS